MAEAFARELGGDAVECASGGTDPYGEVLPAVEEAMAEVEIDLKGHESTPINEDLALQADLVVTMGCGAEACPVFQETEVVDWPVKDPKDRDLEGVRAIRDEVRRRVRQLLADRGALPAFEP